MNLASLDLNLIVALESLLEEASVSRAADRLSLSQPAVSCRGKNGLRSPDLFSVSQDSNADIAVLNAPRPPILSQRSASK